VNYTLIARDSVKHSLRAAYHSQNCKFYTW